ncbi:MAG: DNA polymerase III subunit epsilon [Burkholderiales bacterium]|jgi:DNA polymerase-3 subunit epsilon|nr:DNA polymerase III subunit epsilon [Burkholderiales bacterium]
MRQIFIDTETTGLEPAEGHRVLELAAVEMVSRRVTGKVCHWRLNPEREVDEAAAKIHGMRWEDIKGEPKFAEVAEAFIAFARDAEWIIHNAPFDLGFLNAELARANKPACEKLYTNVVDTLALARSLYPGKSNSLDALCERLNISNAHRVLHGACLDAQLLAEVYLALTRGQGSLKMAAAAPTISLPAFGDSSTPLTVLAANEEERAAHEAYLEQMKTKGGACLWAGFGKK